MQARFVGDLDQNVLVLSTSVLLFQRQPIALRPMKLLCQFSCRNSAVEPRVRRKCVLTRNICGQFPKTEDLEPIRK